MAVAVIMPRQGNTVESCIITAWNKKPGDAVAVGEPFDPNCYVQYLTEKYSKLYNL